MENAFIGTIMAVGYNYAPYGWLLCNGQLLPVMQYQALYAVVGNTYGGVPNQTFGLPDLRGYAIIGSGQSVAPARASAPAVALGAQLGASTANVLTSGKSGLTINSANLPNVPLNGPLDITGLTALSVLQATQSGPGPTTPAPGATAPTAGATLSSTGSGTSATTGNIYYVNPTPSTPVPTVAMNSASVQTEVSNTTTFTSAPIGSGTPLDITSASTTTVPLMQPSLGLTYIICASGVFPTRS